MTLKSKCFKNFKEIHLKIPLTYFNYINGSTLQSEISNEVLEVTFNDKINCPEVDLTPLVNVLQ